MSLGPVRLVLADLRIDDRTLIDVTRLAVDR
jgi:hypothetical protein